MFKGCIELGIKYGIGGLHGSHSKKFCTSWKKFVKKIIASAVGGAFPSPDKLDICTLAGFIGQESWIREKLENICTLSDLIEWFQKQFEKYQSKVNSIIEQDLEQNYSHLENLSTEELIRECDAYLGMNSGLHGEEAGQSFKYKLITDMLYGWVHIVDTVNLFFFVVGMFDIFDISDWVGLGIDYAMGDIEGMLNDLLNRISITADKISHHCLNGHINNHLKDSTEYQQYINSNTKNNIKKTQELMALLQKHFDENEEWHKSTAKKELDDQLALIGRIYDSMSEANDQITGVMTDIVKTDKRRLEQTKAYTRLIIGLQKNDCYEDTYDIITDFQIIQNYIGKYKASLLLEKNNVKVEEGKNSNYWLKLIYLQGSKNGKNNLYLAQYYNNYLKILNSGNQCLQDIFTSIYQLRNKIFIDTEISNEELRMQAMEYKLQAHILFTTLAQWIALLIQNKFQAFTKQKYNEEDVLNYIQVEQILFELNFQKYQEPLGFYDKQTQQNYIQQILDLYSNKKQQNNEELILNKLMNKMNQYVLGRNRDESVFKFLELFYVQDRWFISETIQNFDINTIKENLISSLEGQWHYDSSERTYQKNQYSLGADKSTVKQVFKKWDTEQNKSEIPPTNNFYNPQIFDTQLQYETKCHLSYYDEYVKKQNENQKNLENNLISEYEYRNNSVVYGEQYQQLRSLGMLLDQQENYDIIAKSLENLNSVQKQSGSYFNFQVDNGRVLNIFKYNSECGPVYEQDDSQYKTWKDLQIPFNRFDKIQLLQNNNQDVCEQKDIVEVLKDERKEFNKQLFILKNITNLPTNDWFKGYLFKPGCVKQYVPSQNKDSNQSIYESKEVNCKRTAKDFQDIQLYYTNFDPDTYTKNTGWNLNNLGLSQRQTKYVTDNQYFFSFNYQCPAKEAPKFGKYKYIIQELKILIWQNNKSLPTGYHKITFEIASKNYELFKNKLQNGQSVRACQGLFTGSDDGYIANENNTNRNIDYFLIANIPAKDACIEYINCGNAQYCQTCNSHSQRCQTCVGNQQVDQYGYCSQYTGNTESNGNKNDKDKTDSSSQYQHDCPKEHGCLTCNKTTLTCETCFSGELPNQYGRCDPQKCLNATGCLTCNHATQKCLTCIGGGNPNQNGQCTKNSSSNNGNSGTSTQQTQNCGQQSGCLTCNSHKRCETCPGGGKSNIFGRCKKAASNGSETDGTVTCPKAKGCATCNNSTQKCQTCPNGKKVNPWGLC